MKLNICLHSVKNVTHTKMTPVLMIHGLFGSMNNLNRLVHGLKFYRTILQVDVRNHGLSNHSEEMNYQVMAQDILETLNANSIERVIVVGHSMGGKIAMKMTAIAPERIEKLIILDIAPVSYEIQSSEIFSALNAVTNANTNSRHQAAVIMQQYSIEEKTIQFLLKSFHNGGWRFNLQVIQKQYMEILDWQSISSWQNPTLFIRGECSNYVNERYYPLLLKQFPHAYINMIRGSGHWLHIENSEIVLSLMGHFLRL
ncbi:MAG: alpha/beta fold hydrolase [Candidatus Dasytiphilus stammeri]